MRYNWVPWYSVHARRERTEAERERSREALRKLWLEKGTLYPKVYEEREMAYLRERFGVEEEVTSFEVLPELREEGEEGTKGTGYRRFNNDVDYAMTLEEIGEEMGVSRERIRSIETKALAKIRRAFELERPPGFKGREAYSECLGYEAFATCK